MWKPTFISFEFLVSYNNIFRSTTGVIDNSNNTIVLEVLNGTTLTSLKASFEVPEGCTVKVGSDAQTSGTTVNNFTNAVTYEVYSANGCVQSYSVSLNLVEETKQNIELPEYGGSITIKSIDTIYKLSYTIYVQKPSDWTITFYVNDELIYNDSYTFSSGTNDMTSYFLYYFAQTADSGTYMLNATMTNNDSGITYSDSREFTIQ